MVKKWGRQMWKDDGTVSLIRSLQQREHLHTTGIADDNETNYTRASAKRKAHWRFNFAPKRSGSQRFSTLVECPAGSPRRVRAAGDDKTPNTFIHSARIILPIAAICMTGQERSDTGRFYRPGKASARW